MEDDVSMSSEKLIVGDWETRDMGRGQESSETRNRVGLQKRDEALDVNSWEL